MHEEVRETPMYAFGGGAVLRVGLIACIGAAILIGFAIRTAVHGDSGGGRFGFWIGAAILAGIGTAELGGLTWAPFARRGSGGSIPGPNVARCRPGYEPTRPQC